MVRTVLSGRGPSVTEIKPQEGTSICGALSRGEKWACEPKKPNGLYNNRPRSGKVSRFAVDECSETPPTAKFKPPRVLSGPLPPSNGAPFRRAPEPRFLPSLVLSQLFFYLTSSSSSVSKRSRIVDASNNSSSVTQQQQQPRETGPERVCVCCQPVSWTRI